MRISLKVWRQAGPDAALLRETRAPEEKFPAEPFEERGYNVAARGEAGGALDCYRQALELHRTVGHRDDDGWWVERDNPREGTDSWSAGPLTTEQVLGVVLVRLWPLRRRRTN